VFQLITDHKQDNPVHLPTDLAVVIGRGDTCDVQLKDPSASRVHCRVIAHAGRVTLYDAGSRWGTFVNDRRITKCDLKPGDRVRIGETILRLEVQSDAHHTTLAPRSQLNRPFDSTSLSIVGLVNHPVIDEGTSADDSSPVDDRFAPPAARVLTSRKQAFSPGEFIGSPFHRYKVLSLIAETRGGIVFRAETQSDGSPLALKIFKPSMLKTPTDELRFTRAVKTMFGQRHPHIVELHNAGCWNGWYFTASEFVDGISAVDLIRQIGIVGMLPADRVLKIAFDLCQSLRFAEELNVVHRNIKPSNILLRRENACAMLNDLILSRSIETDSEQLTQAGDIVGDVNYMSPEQLGSGFPLDHRSDIYQLGATLYELLTGHPPSEAGSVAATIMQILTDVPASVRSRNLAVPDSINSIVMKMLAKNPANRYQSAAELHVDLEKTTNATAQNRVRSRDADPRATGWGGALDGLF
jgi:hypothetical protein